MYMERAFLAAIATVLVANVVTTSNSSSTAIICLVTDFDSVKTACDVCSNIIIDGITVPPGEQLIINLKDGANLTFKGEINFGFKNWEGALVAIYGNHVTVKGDPGHILNGNGQLYWDGKPCLLHEGLTATQLLQRHDVVGIGQQGSIKPTFIRVHTTNGSLLEDINVLNCPERCVSVQSTDTTFDRWNIDVSLGDTKGGHNTDGFDISLGKNLVFNNTVVKNQDDCVAINSGSNLTFDNLECHGCHGLSLSVGLSDKNGVENRAENIFFSNSKVIDADNGIHIKTHPNGGTGLISNVVYQNIELTGIRNYGIYIEQDYEDKGNLNANVPIRDLTMKNVTGTIANCIDCNRTNVYIACASGGCSEWHWSEIDIIGGDNDCNYEPSGFTC